MNREKINQFELQATSRLWIYQEAQDTQLTNLILNFFRLSHKYADFIHNVPFHLKSHCLSNPDQILTCGNKIIICEMKSSLRSIRFNQINNIPHNAYWLLKVLQENEPLQQYLGVNNPVMKRRLQEIYYDPTDPFSNWLVFPRQKNLKGLLNEKGFIEANTKRTTPVPRQFEGPSIYLPVTLEYDGKTAGVPIFHRSSYENEEP